MYFAIMSIIMVNVIKKVLITKILLKEAKINKIILTSFSEPTIFTERYWKHYLYLKM